MAIVTDTATTQTHERWRILGSRCRVRRLTDRAYAASVRPCSSVPDNPGGSSGQRVQRGVRLRAGGLDVVEERALRRFVERSALPGLGRPECENDRSEEHTSELQSRLHLVCRLLLEKKKKKR